MATSSKDEPSNASVPQASETNAHGASTDNDSDPDFDDLDDVLDQFSANAPASLQQPPTSSQPQVQPSQLDTDKGTEKLPLKADDVTIPAGPQPSEDEDQFIQRLQAEMQSMITSMGQNPNASLQSPEEIAKMGEELEDFTRKMEAEGIQPEHLLKAILGQEEGEQIIDAAKDTSTNVHPSASTDKQPRSPLSPGPSKGSTSFEDTIRRTMSRLDESNTSATHASAEASSKSEEDLLADMLKALEASGGGGSGEDGEDGLSKMFLDMMQQLTHKDMLYEPMKELHTQYPAWLDSHKPPTLSQNEFERYTRQSYIVADMVRKFEEPGYSDEDAACRDFIWEKMQAMQGEGAPPEELVKNPFPGTDFGGIPGLGGGGNVEGLEDGCPTQ